MHRDILRDNRALLIKNMEPRKLLSHLSRTLDEADDEEIKAQSTRGKCSEKLLDILLRKGQNAFDEFVKALKKEESQFLALALIEAGNMEEPYQLSGWGERREERVILKLLEANKLSCRSNHR